MTFSTELRFALATLSTWRVTHLLAGEDGPFELLAKFRGLLGQGWMGRAMDCFYCLSVWVSAPFALLVASDLCSWWFVLLALSGGACLLEQATARSQDVFFAEDVKKSKIK
jgi:Protein of unknown function (DUF1360)